MIATTLVTIKVNTIKIDNIIKPDVNYQLHPYIDRSITFYNSDNSKVVCFLFVINDYLEVITSAINAAGIEIVDTSNIKYYEVDFDGIGNTYKMILNPPPILVGA